MTPNIPLDLCVSRLRDDYLSGSRTPCGVVADILEAQKTHDENPIWIHRVDDSDLMARARSLEAMSQDGLPLYGIPFAVKDNIDVAGLPTTAACPEFSYIAGETAPAVQLLLDAGAILIGKTNLDQFATGLVGVRSPWGACQNAFDASYVSGGSSSGSAVAVSLGLVSFALGTDTAGSGRVPAGFNNLIGLKPTLGRISTRGVVPACQTLDCVSVFALTASDAKAVLDVAGEYDAAHPWSRDIADTPAYRNMVSTSQSLRIAISNSLETPNTLRNLRPHVHDWNPWAVSDMHLTTHHSPKQQRCFMAAPGWPNDFMPHSVLRRNSRKICCR